MHLHEYFANTSGTGILATADSGGRVDVAIYAKPHVLENDTVAFIMRDRLTHANLQSNPHAAYLFLAEGEGREGLRLFLEKIREDDDSELIAAMTRRHLSPEKDRELGPKFIVVFRITNQLPLVGAGN
ncbi:MAG: pyridoxamine 5'-phosphate oxidase family protein [Thermodesulfobacteriota bacterium]